MWRSWNTKGGGTDHNLYDLMKKLTGVLKVQNHLIHSKIIYNRSIWQEKYWIVTRFRKSLFCRFVPDKREEANNAMKNKRRDLLGMRVCRLFPNRHWPDLYLPTDSRGYGVFGPCLAGWYERDMTLLFVGGYEWGPLSGARRGGRYLTMLFVGGSNRGPLGGTRRGSTPPPSFYPSPSSLDFWLGFFYNLDITKIIVIVFIWGRGDEFLVSILCIAIVPVVIPVPSSRGFYRSSLSGPWQCGGLQNSMRTASLSASKYFNIIVREVLICVACFLPIGNRPHTCPWRVRLPLFRFDPFLLSLDISPLLDLYIVWDLL